MIDKKFFQKYQKILLWFANNSFGRWFFKIQNDCPKDKKIIKIQPNCFTWFDKVENKNIYYKTDFRTHSKFSKRLNCLFSWLPFNAVKKIELAGQWYLQPKFGLTISTFYPDADAETNSVDGMVSHLNASGDIWSNIRDGTGTSADDTTASNRFIYIYAYTVENQWQQIDRSIFLFNTASINTDTISGAVLSLYGNGKDNDSAINIDINIYSSNPNTNTTLVAGDYDSLGTTAFCDTSITYASWNIAGYNDFTLNASGITAINKTGITKFGARNAALDVANTPPSWVSGLVARLNGYFADQTGTTNDPKLVVTHTTSASTNNMFALF